MSDKTKKFEGKTLKDMLVPSTDDDLVLLMAKIAFKEYQANRLSKDDLLYILKKCVNVRALENGYAERFGLPFGSV